MKENKKVREELERIYGKGCMFKKANMEKKIEEKKIEEKTTIKSYKKFIEERHFTSKKIQFYEEQMNLHHLQHRSEGGKTTMKNGAVVSSLAHMYMHSLPRNQEEIINNGLREYKKSIECGVEYVDDLDIDFEINAMEFRIQERQKDISESESEEKNISEEKNKNTYNRAKEKRELQNMTKDIIDR